MPRTYDPNGFTMNTRRTQQVGQQQNQQVAYNAAQQGPVTSQGYQLPLVSAPTTDPYTQQAMGNANLTGLNPQGGIATNAVQRMRDAGMNDAQIQARVQDPQFQQNIQQAFNQVGTSGNISSPAVLQRQQTRLQQQNQAIDEKYRKAAEGGQSIDPAAIAGEKSAFAQQVMAEDTAEAQRQQQEGQKIGQNAAAGNATDMGLAAALNNLPPEAQAIAPLFQNLLSSIQQNQQDSQKTTDALLNGGTVNVNGKETQVTGINQTFDTIDQKISDMASGYTQMQEGIQNMLKEVKDDQERYISEQQRSEEARLQWNLDQQERTLRDQQRKAIDSKIASLAIRGGFGSDGGLREIEETRAGFEQAIRDVQQEFGVQKTELSAKFTGLYLQASNEYTKNSIQNIKDTAAALERIAGQSISSSQARASAQQGIIKDFVASQASARKDYADTIKTFATQMMDMVTADKRLQYQEEAATRRMRFQEQQADKRFSMQLDNQSRTQMNNDRKMEQQQQDDIRALVRTANSDPDVTRYKEIRSGNNRIQAILQEAISTKDPNKLGAAKTLALTLVAKVADPTTGVREGELEKFGKSQSWVERVKNANNAIFGGDLTGLSMDTVKAYAEAIDLINSEEKNNALAAFSSAINSTITYNSRSQFYPLSPAEIGIPQEFLQDAAEAFSSYHAAQDRLGQGYNFTWDTNEGGGGETFADDLSSLGRFTQVFDTPIASKSNGGLYADSTVQAWGGKHAGVDIAMPQGMELPSLVDGVVVESGYEPGWGGTVVIRDARGGEHRISHLSEVDLQPGQYVRKNQVVGLTGGKPGTKGAGNSTGAHVDYRVRVDGRYVNPLTYNTNA